MAAGKADRGWTVRRARATWAGWIAAVVLTGAGCGGKTTGDVHGTVTFDGTPVETGTITFFPLDGVGATAGGNIKNGAFSVPKVPAGAAKVVITAAKVVGEVPLYNTPNSPTRKKVEQFLPPIYSNIEKSELRYEVTAGENLKDFELPAK